MRSGCQALQLAPPTAPLAPPPDISAVQAAWEAQFAAAPPSANGHAPSQAAWANGHAPAVAGACAGEGAGAAPDLAHQASCGAGPGAPAWPGVGASPSKRRKVGPGHALRRLAGHCIYAICCRCCQRLTKEAGLSMLWPLSFQLLATCFLTIRDIVMG